MDHTVKHGYYKYNSGLRTMCWEIDTFHIGVRKNHILSNIKRAGARSHQLHENLKPLSLKCLFFRSIIMLCPLARDANERLLCNYLHNFIAKMKNNFWRK